MAIIKKDGNFMGLPMNIQRGNPIPLDDSSVYYSRATMETYAKSGVTAYVGQIITLVDESAKTCEAYMIANEAGTLIKLASTTASGDLAGDVADLQTQVASIITEIGKKAAGEEAATGLYKEIADVLAVANAKVASVKASDNSVEIGGTATAPTVKAKISAVDGNSLSVKEDGLYVEVPEVVHPEYKLVEAAAPTAGMLKSYKLTKDGADITGSVVIDIPKDMVVKGGSVETYTEGNLPAGVTEPGTYIVITLSNDDKLYVKADDLVDIYGGGTATDGIITVNVDPANKKITATIADGTITKAKLVAVVQASLDKADSAVQSVVAGSANGTISVDGNDVEVTGLQDAAYVTVESLNTTAQGYADAAKEAAVGVAADTSDKDTIKGAKKYADEKAAAALDDAKAAAVAEIAKLDVTDTAVDHQFVTKVDEVDGKIAVTRAALVAADIPELGQSKIAGLVDALAGKQATVAFDGEYSSTNKAATVNTVNTAVAGVVSNGADVAADDTIKGAKLYADSKASAAESAAKAYADSIVSGEGGISKDVSDLKTRMATAESDIDTLEGKVDVAKVSTAIATAKSEAIEAAGTAADGKVSALETKLNATIKTAQDTADEAKTAAATADGKAVAAQNDVDALETLVGALPEGASSKTVVGYVDEQIGKIPAQVDYTVTCDTSSPSGVAKRYTLSQKGGAIATIDIPKDMVVESGAVEEKTEAGVWGVAGTYLVLTLANATSDKVYINVGDLIEYVTGATAADGIITTSVDAAHVLTATIGDGKIVKAKLAKAVQDSLALADSAIQEADLAPYAKTADVVAKEDGKRLMTNDEGAKLAGIATGAQVNKLESVKVGGTALEIAEDKSVDITEISTDLLKQGTMTLVLNGGNAAILANG